MGCNYSADDYSRARIIQIEEEIVSLQKEKQAELDAIKRRGVSTSRTVLELPKSVTRVVKDVGEVSKDLAVVSLLQDRKNNNTGTVDNNDEDDGDSDSDSY